MVCGLEMNKKTLEGFKALAFLMEQSARYSPNPKEGRLLPKPEKKK